MAECGLFFGNAEYLTWLPAPDGEARATPQGWGASGGFVNGGAFVRRSQNHHKTYNFGWTMKRRDELAKVLDFYEGRYGQGPFHMVMPGTHDNILPKSWSLPRVTLTDGPHWAATVEPTLVEAPVATLGRPHVGVRYEVTDDSLERLTATIPVPPGYFLHFGVHGTFADGLRMVLNGQDVAALPMDSEDLTNLVLSAPGLYTLSLEGTGTADIFSMTARLSETASDVDRHREFVVGRGTSAVDFEPDSVEVTVSSAARDYYHGTANFVEVGQWGH